MMNRTMKTKTVKFEGGKFLHGEKNAITDLPGVKVGHLTLNKDVEDASGIKKAIRTGLTAVLPYPMEKDMRIFAGFSILRGTHEITGYEVLDDFCYLNSPIVIVNSLNVGITYDAILSYGFSFNREIWPPLVISIDDSYLNDMREGPLGEKEILGVLHHAKDGRVEEGSVGIGLGLRVFDWKGGIGTSSRLLDLDHHRYTCGVLVASNFGNQTPSGSLVIIVGVDIPLVPYHIKQVTSSLIAKLSGPKILKNFSDSIFCVLFTTANPMSMDEERALYDFQIIEDSLMEKIVLAGTEAAKAAIFHSLIKASSVEGRLGREAETIQDEMLRELLNDLAVSD